MDTTSNQTFMATANETPPVNCEYYPQSSAIFNTPCFRRFSKEGSGWSLLSAHLLPFSCVIENLFLVIVLAQKKQNRHSLFLYIMLLAFFDFLIAVFYIPLMSVSVLADYALAPEILNAWFSYFRLLITICHINSAKVLLDQLSSSAFITKISMYFEYSVTHEEVCVGTMAEYGLKPAPIIFNYYYNLFWRIGFRNLVTIWLPFLLLLVMNMKIIHALRNTDEEPVIKQKLSEIQRKNRVRTATRTLILVVFSYLMANLLNVIITLWEFFDYESLTNETFLPFYTYGVDVVSILTVLAGAFRPLIYLACMPQVRKDIIAQLHRCAGRNKYKPDQLKDEEKFGISNVLIRISELLLKYPNFSSRTSIDSNITDDISANCASGDKTSGEVFL
ncbi:G-PROTEIN-RECEP-F1-2 domain-containing protein [Aphelenchoides bicaudatus]|nr:G-PROTEIN-RECEP-F1-2 domain-containing protein [Aphelenchoides bicaudatus]